MTKPHKLLKDSVLDDWRHSSLPQAKSLNENWRQFNISQYRFRQLGPKYILVCIGARTKRTKPYLPWHCVATITRTTIVNSVNEPCKECFPLSTITCGSSDPCYSRNSKLLLSFRLTRQSTIGTRSGSDGCCVCYYSARKYNVSLKFFFSRWNQQISCRSLRPEHLKTWANFLESRNRWKAYGSPIDATRDAKCVRTIWKVGKRFRYYSPPRLVKKCKCKVFSMGAERNLKD